MRHLGIIFGSALMFCAFIKNADIYQDDRLAVRYPAEWSQQIVYQTIGGASISKRKMGVVLKDGQFHLYLLTHEGQASGDVGGRFGEIAKFVAPWLRPDEPSACFNSFETKTTVITNQLSRVDVMLLPNAPPSADAPCSHLVRPPQGVRWVGAYYGPTSHSGQLPGFFLRFPIDARGATFVPSDQMVFAETFAAKTERELPDLGDRALTSFRKTTDTVVSNIQYH